MHLYISFSFSALLISAVLMNFAAGFALPFAYGGMDRDENDTVGPYQTIQEAPITPSRYYMDTMEKRVVPNAGSLGPSPRGPLDDCKSYFDCRQRFIKYLDSLAKIGRMGR